MNALHLEDADAFEAMLLDILANRTDADCDRTGDAEAANTWDLLDDDTRAHFRTFSHYAGACREEMRELRRVARRVMVSAAIDGATVGSRGGVKLSDD